jgi:hypothetical protein
MKSYDGEDLAFVPELLGKLLILVKIFILMDY